MSAATRLTRTRGAGLFSSAVGVEDQVRGNTLATFDFVAASSRAIATASSYDSNRREVGMHVLDPGIIVPDVIVGSIASIGGVFVVVFRRQLRDWVVSSEKVRFGEQRGNALGVVALVQHVGGA